MKPAKLISKFSQTQMAPAGFRLAAGALTATLVVKNRDYLRSKLLQNSVEANALLGMTRLGECSDEASK